MTVDFAKQVRSLRTLEKAWLAIQRNARTSKSEDTKNEVATFAANVQANLRRINRQLQKQTFVFPPAKGLKIPKDKKDKSSFRPLVLAKVEARVVQRAIHDILVTVPEIQRFVRTTYSFGGIKKLKEDELSAVPAAIKAVLDAIGNGGKYVIRSDITSFFTKIPKSTVTNIIAKAVQNDEFLTLFTKAIKVELENMAQLRGAVGAFPIEDIGVAQGNSLSPLLGNIILYDFDKELNKYHDVKCIRYIDDFIIVAPNKSIAENTYSKALSILKNFDMETSERKTKRASIQEGFDFLGIDLSNGFIRPGKKSQERVLASINKTISDSITSFREYKNIGEIDRSMSLIYTMNKISGIIQGWGKHYRFCNDTICLQRLDDEISQSIKMYLSIYREVREKISDAGRWKLLGIEALSQIERTPFLWPKSNRSVVSIPQMPMQSIEDYDPTLAPWEY